MASEEQRDELEALKSIYESDQDFKALSDTIFQLKMASEEQRDELEALKSIYESDQDFKALSDTIFQYKFGSNGVSRSFVLQISWPPDYPSATPSIDLSAFYNSHLTPSFRQNLLSCVAEHCAGEDGMPLTFSIIEFIRDNLDQLLDVQPETLPIKTSAAASASSSSDDEDEAGGKEGKKGARREAMTKAQKRKMWDRGAATEDARERGWNWVEIVKHLSQTGGQTTVE